MFYRCCIIICICLAGLRVTIHAQRNINFTSLTTRDGLSSNTVNAILKDHSGLMWFATEDGLNKFDGTNFTAYRHQPDDSTSLPTNEILSLHEDKLGNLWVGTGGESLSLYDRQKDAFINFPYNKGSNSISNNVISGICSDYQGKIWVATYAGVNIIDPVTRNVSHFYIHPHQPFNKTSSCFFEDSHHNIWIGTDEGVFLYNRLSNLVKQFAHTPGDQTSLSGNIVHALTEDKYGNMWIGTTTGLSMLQPGKKAFVNYRHEEGNSGTLSNSIINSLAVDEENQLWVGTGDGLDIIDIPTGAITRLQSDLKNVHRLTSNGIASLYIDKQGISWVGTYRGGIFKYDKNLNLFNLVQDNPLDEEGLHAKVVTSFAEDSNGKVFVGTDGGGINLFDPTTRASRHFNLQSRLKSTDPRIMVLALKMTTNKQLLAGTFSDGLFVVEPASGRYRQFIQGNNLADLNSNDIFCIMEDHLGNRWIGTNGGGLNVLNKENQVFVRFTPNPTAANDIKLPINGYIRDIVEDKDGYIWIATHGGGIAMYNSLTKGFKIYNTANSNLPSDKVQSLLQDSHGNMWAGTLGGGLCLLNKKTGQFIIFSEKDGLQNDNIRTITEDKNGLIWLSSNKGLSSLNVAEKKINNYNYHNGVQHNNFVHGAGLCASDGSLYFGGLEGFNYFNPLYLKKNKNIPPVLITELKVSNQLVTPSPKGPIKENILVAKEIHIDYKQNFSLSFVGLNYTVPEQNQYAYKLEGFEKDWNYVGNSTTASYTNIGPGEYLFRVIASNNDGVWNKEGTSVKVFVHPPFWRTTYAYIFYGLVVATLLFYSRHRGIQRLKRKFNAEQKRKEVEQERKEAERLHELDQLKIKFLTNLSHEFRTPISLILGPTDTLLSQASNVKQIDQLQLIKRNSKRLLNLVNQLLDFRKMEEHELKLQLSNGELVSFVKEVADSFKDLSERRKTGFVFTSDLKALHTEFDHNKLERILFNLLSNAFKFTLEGGTVSLTLEKITAISAEHTTWVAIKIRDTGIGIPAGQQEKIFDRFFQHTTTSAILNQGTGIGLSITREFVEMHGGTITVESEPGKSTVFTVALPLVKLPEANNIEPQILAPLLSAEMDAEIPLVETAEKDLVNEVQTSSEMSSVLLVEDDDDFRYYLKDNLQLHYKVYEAANGKEGWQKALAQHPQLIVSDISMPYMDGIELCRKLKSDKRTNHIPIILLTARTGEEAQLRGLETGANDYITKPFNFEVLSAKVKNLLILNNTLKQTYTRYIKVQASDVKIESEGEQLMENIMRYLDENLTDSQLSVEELSRHVGMSRSSLYSKLLELTNQTPVEFIRSVKLDKAAVLLEKSDMTIAQIAYSVGFSTPNYFTKSFKTKFNMLPSEYVQKKKTGNKNTAAEATDDSSREA